MDFLISRNYGNERLLEVAKMESGGTVEGK